MRSALIHITLQGLIRLKGTSHLDIAKEREVNAALAQLNITRVIIAHRPETIAAADRVVEFRNGRIAADSASVPAVIAA